MRIKKCLSIVKVLTCLILFSFFVVTSCKKDAQVEPTEELLSANLLAATASVGNSGYNIENALPKGYVTNGTKDYTSYIQTAINKYDVVTFPAFPIMVSDKGLMIGSNKTLNFLKGSELRLKGTKARNYHILRIYKATNVTINNPVIIGDRETHLTSSGEFGSGITVQSSVNVTINNANITNCWGDGIYLGHVSGQSVNKNIVINDAYLKKNRRDGISIIAVDGLALNNVYAGYTDGTKPMCGINFEPNGAEDELKNIKILNPITEYNGGNGIQIGTRHLLMASRKDIDITITNHNDLASKEYAMKVSCLRKSGSGTVSGEIKIINPIWKNPKSGKPLLVYMDQKNVKTTISNPTVTTSNSLLNFSSTQSLLNKGVSMGSLVINEDNLDSVPDAPTPVGNSGYNIQEALPKGFVTNGTKDYTSYIQTAIDKYSVVTFPAFPILISDEGLTIGSNKTINFLKGAELRLKGTGAKNYQIMRISSATNVTINNPVIVGDRASHLTSSGEFGSGIMIQSSSNVTINNASVTNCWGDGIYLGHINGQSVNKNIVINDAYLKKNRRVGISIVAVDGLALNNVYAGYTDGTSPMCGINFQPNSAENELKNIKILNPTTEYNGGMGIQIGTRDLLLASRKEIDITITNHKDLASKEYAMKVSSLRKSGSGTVSGTIKIVNPTWKNPVSGKPLLVYMDQKDVKTTISNPTVTTSNSILNLNSVLSLLNKGVSMGSLTIN